MRAREPEGVGRQRTRTKRFVQGAGVGEGDGMDGAALKGSCRMWETLTRIEKLGQCRAFANVDHFGNGEMRVKGRMRVVVCSL